MEKKLQSTKLEKVLYGFGDIGGNLVWSFAGAFLTLYYTDSVGLSAAFAGTMMLFCRIFDGVSDIIMGIIIDKTRSRFGKARAWFLFSIIPLVLVFLAVFNVPSGLSESGKNTYTFITYFLLSVIFYTANNLAFHAMLPRFSLTSQDRSIVSIVRTVFAIITIMIINIITPILLASFGGEDRQTAWTIITAIYGIIAIVCFFVTFFGVKEKIPAVEPSETKAYKEPPMREALKVLLSSRYFYIAIFLFFSFYIINGTQGVGIYYARDVLGNANYFGIISMISVIPMVISMPFIPFLFKKFGKRNIMAAGMVISAVSAAVTLINPESPAFYLALSAIRAFGVVPLSVAIFTLAGDIVDYNDMKRGIRTEGITTAANSMGMKLGTGLGAGMLGWMLAWGKYNGTLTVQPESAITAMIILAIVIPLILAVISFVLLLLWDLDKYAEDVQNYLKNKNYSTEAE